MTTKQLVAIASGLILAGGLAVAGDRNEDDSFRKLDKNKDDYISQSEAVADKDLVAHFKDIDRNKYGYLTPSEFGSREESEEAE